MQTGRPSSRPRPPFGQRVYALREAAGLTQAEVAERLGISARAYAFWEREPVALKPDQLAQLARILGARSVDELLGEKNGKKRGTGPAGRMRRLFEAASRLPRTQQDKVAAVIEPFVQRHAGNG
ncbi:MAG: helix-turn-helix domain-containing protein [Kiritimatiellae bacterium]|nr:helix-turn-helix domain-containing protein [Kiritimatiellia bacterium]